MSEYAQDVIRDSKGRVLGMISAEYEPDDGRMMHALLILLGYSESEIGRILSIPESA